jgi:molybdopterin-biosynthesis enzyme MoeA-like protein
MEGVADHLGLGLVVDPDIDRRITRALERTAGEGGTVTPAHEASMRRMARVPDGAYLLSRAPGVAPGVAVDVDGGCDADAGATVVILPGIPGELRRIVTESVEPTLLAGRGQPQHVAELTHGYPESALNVVFDRLVADFPDVHLGSYPGRVCTVRLKGGADRVEAAMALVRAELAALDAAAGSAALRAGWAARHEGS